VFWFRSCTDSDLHHGLSQVVGANHLIGELSLAVGGRKVALRPAQVMTKLWGPDWISGNIGKDLLTQTDSFTIDYAAMTVTLAGLAE
jgi:hypothetical protein